MFELFKQAFIAILSFSKSLTAKCISLNNQPCTTRPTFINLTPDYSLLVKIER